MIKRKLHMRLLAAALVICLCTAGCAAGDSQKQETGKRSIIIAGSTSVQPLSEMLAEAYMEQNREVEIEVQGGGSGQGIKAIETKIAHIGSLSRDIKEEEEAAISREYTIAREGIAVVVNPEVKVDELSLEQIRDIYNGTIRNWKEVGGQDGLITVVTREEGSGTRGSFTELAGLIEKDHEGKERDRTTKDALVQPSTGAVRETVLKTPDSIGYISLGILDDRIKALKIEGTKPSADTVLSGDYKLQRPFIYVTGSHVSEETKKYLDFVMSPKGQKIAAENGFIPVKRTAEKDS